VVHPLFRSHEDVGEDGVKQTLWLPSGRGERRARRWRQSRWPG
jgi:hypothetical protein